MSSTLNKSNLVNTGYENTDVSNTNTNIHHRQFVIPTFSTFRINYREVISRRISGTN